jgi:hypothetical protein
LEDSPDRTTEAFFGKAVLLGFFFRDKPRMLNGWALKADNYLRQFPAPDFPDQVFKVGTDNKVVYIWLKGIDFGPPTIPQMER